MRRHRLYRQAPLPNQFPPLPQPPSGPVQLWANPFAAVIFPTDLPATSSIARLAELCCQSASNTSYPEPRQNGIGAEQPAFLKIVASSRDDACDQYLEIIDRCVRSGEYNMLLTEVRDIRM